MCVCIILMSLNSVISMFTPIVGEKPLFVGLAKAKPAVPTYVAGGWRELEQDCGLAFKQVF